MVKQPKKRGAVIWITGLSGSGKTTLGQELVRHYNLTHRLCVFLDGDELRGALGEIIDEDVKFELNTRKKLAFFYSKLSLNIAEQGHLVIVATVSLFNEIHKWNRTNLPNYCEIVLDTPLQELRNRNSKNVHTSNKKLEMSPVTGINFAAEFPEAPDITFMNYPFKDPAEMASKIVSLLETKANM